MPVAKEGPRERLVSAAYELFLRHGLRAVGVDRIVDEAGVAKATLYRHFPSKDDLVVAALARREELWTRGWLEREVEQLGAPPGACLIAIFDLFDRWFQREDFEGCMFHAALLESRDREDRVGKEALKKLANVRSFVARLAGEAGVGDPHAFALEWQILMHGAIVSATIGDLEAAKRAREVGRGILDREKIA
jgi:AcrR family transcriptional regulator